MKETALWEFIRNGLKKEKAVCMLAVLDSNGSSPGRAGFKMALSLDGEMSGSIGGGVMEFKLVEYAKKLLHSPDYRPVLKKQIHSKKAPKNQSGMICSGEQTVAFYFLGTSDLPVIETLLKAADGSDSGSLILNNAGISFDAEKPAENRRRFSGDAIAWIYTEAFPYRDAIYIFGAGHVSLALSKLMQFLNFKVFLFDDRPELNTFLQNEYATQKQLISYSEAGKYIPENNESYVVIMTVGYRTDKIVLESLIGRRFKYLGLMGSKAKIKQLFADLKEEGNPEESLNQVFAPIGIPIKSKTPEEIAVSIAAQIIKIKNA